MIKSNKPKRLAKEKKAFSLDEAKLYITALILLFHVFPLVLKAVTPAADVLLLNYVMLIVNPMIIVIVMLIYGIKQGFNKKMPIICILLATISVPMYYDIEVDPNMGLLYYYLISTSVALIEYTIFTFAAVFVGSLIKESFLR